MTPTTPRASLVRASRDGDQFHYLWAARRCLLLLDPGSDFAAIAIEGGDVISSGSRGTRSRPTDVDEVIDVAEYYGSVDDDAASAVRFVQLKHSTLRANETWAPSGLRSTLSRFALKFRELVERYGAQAVEDRFTFVFVSNRPVHPDLVAAIDDIAAGRPSRHGALLRKLKHYTNLDGDELAAFARRLEIDDRQDAYALQRRGLASDLGSYLPDADADAPVQLKELVTRKALSESAANNRITKYDVLRALGTDVPDLFPAPNLIERMTEPVMRARATDIAATILEADASPVLLHAEGGVGKSVFVSGLASLLPPGSACIVYDSFGNGLYRSATGLRHPHKVSLVQVANELASRGLCHPLIPTAKADASAYLRAFIHRLAQAADALRHSRPDSPGAVVCIVIDAADNAEVAAQELGTRSSARELLRERMPPGVRLVVVTRTHRQQLLDPPPTIVRVELPTFDEVETAANLRFSFPSATDADAKEFHRLTGGNPRLQANAISAAEDLPDLLRSVGPEPGTVEGALRTILEDAIRNLKDALPVQERAPIDAICTALATLRPPIPIRVVAEMTGLDVSAIRSFALDLGRPLLLNDETIRFRDEPAETWFRDTFCPRREELEQFVARLRPLAASSVYVASVLPALMLEAGMLEELVGTALDATDLPATSELDRREVELQRLQFALKASLRDRRWTYAAKLAFKGGIATAGNARQLRLLQDNTDLAGIFLPPDHLLALVARREFGSSWTGSHHAFDAGLLSAQSQFRSEARSHLRMAREWVLNWSQRPSAEREKEEFSYADIAEIGLAQLNVRGPRACALWLRTWTPRTISYDAGLLVAARLVDHGRYDDLNALSLAADNDVGLVLAVNEQLRSVGRLSPAAAVSRAVDLLVDRRVPPPPPVGYGSHAGMLDGVIQLVVAAHAHGSHEVAALSALLVKYLPEEPPRGLVSRHGMSQHPLLRAYALRAGLTGNQLQLVDIAHPELRDRLDSKTSQRDSSDVREFREYAGALLPWYKLWAKAVLQIPAVADVEQGAATALSQSRAAMASTYREDPFLQADIAAIWFEVLTTQSKITEGSFAAFDSWLPGLSSTLPTRTLTALARRGARHTSSAAQSRALSYASSAESAIESGREHADTAADELVAVSRALLAFSRAEAAAHFEGAVQIASRVGDENLSRWEALISLAEGAARPTESEPRLAYQFARCAELTYAYVARDKHFAWTATLEALAGLCPRSSLAIASRWRDRGFGNPRRILPIVATVLMKRGALDPRAVQALTSIRASWEKGTVLAAALAEAGAPGERSVLWQHALKYAGLEPPPAETWRRFSVLRAQYGLPAENLDAFLTFSERETEEREERDTRSHSPIGGPREAVRDWDRVFLGVDLSSAEGVALAHERFLAGDPPLDRKEFYTRAAAIVPVGGEASFVTAASAIGSFDVYECREFLASLPAAWRSQRGVRAAIERAVRHLCTSRWMEISLSRYWQPLPLTVICEATGLSSQQVVDLVLSSAGSAVEPFDSDRMFALAGMIAIRLEDPIAAQEALKYGLDQFDAALSPTDGDGPWSSSRDPAGDMSDALAGYLWAGLGHPRDVVRWETAHAVLGMAAFGLDQLLARVVAFASSGSGAIGGAGPFTDATLPFYRYNAIQWLVLALRRAAADWPSAVAPHIGFLTRLALNEAPHVIIRDLAARACLSVAAAQPGLLHSSQVEQLHGVNVSPFPRTVRRGYRDDEDTEDSTHDEKAEGRLFFGIDIGPYWFAPLASRFGLSQRAFEARVTRVLREQWGVQGTGRWDADPRSQRELYQDRETWHSHGTRPRTDNLNFYFSYHALMIVAGQLLAERPVVQRYDYEEDFAEWLADHSLTRSDGRWLADRRDPAPLDLPSWGHHDWRDRALWRASLQRSDFDAQLFRADGRLTVRGSWTRVREYRAETVVINSALVTPERSRSLLAALHSASDPSDYSIPDEGADLEILRDGYELRGWVATRDTRSGIDDRDPWSGGISYPGPAPSEWICSLMNLRGDPEQRTWRRDDEVSLVSQLWGEFEDEQDREEANRGFCLHASTAFLGSLLRATGRDLIVKVLVDRRAPYGRGSYSSDESDEQLGPFLSSVRVFLIKGDGRVYTL